MIRVQCPSCGSKLRAPDEALGKKTKCPQCGSIVLVDPSRAAMDDVLEPEVVGGPDDAYGFDDVGETKASSGPVASGEARRPCPVCGEMIMASAAKCRYCGEIFDAKLRGQSDPKTLRDFRKNIHGLAGAFIVLGGLVLIAAVAISALAQERVFDPSLVGVLIIIAGLWVVLGIFQALKQLWAVYGGLALCYFNLIMSVINLGMGARGPSGGGGGIFGIAIIVVIIAQGHRTLKLASQLKKARIPLNAKP